ncbi:hypothetical protein emb_1d0047 [Coriobacteriaceae bacterium EMTCatB1]|nr:hypothetical protein emb_1d0047 [Coriobacteriaceae bacterium EMTCatB1]
MRKSRAAERKVFLRLAETPRIHRTEDPGSSPGIVDQIAAASRAYRSGPCRT